MNSVTRRRLAALLLLVASSCAAGRIAHPGELPGREISPVDLSAIPEDFRDDVGFDRLREGGQRTRLRTGQTALYRMTLHTERGERTWFVRLRVASAKRATMRITSTSDPDAPTYRLRVAPIDVEVHEQFEEREVRASQLSLPDAPHRHSPYAHSLFVAPLLAAGIEDPDLTPEQRERVALGSGTLLAVFEGWQSDAELGSILKEVVGTPVGAAFRSLLSGDLSYSIEPLLDEDETVEVTLPAPVGALTARRMPLQVTMGGTTLLHVELLAAEPDAPLTACAGLVGIRGAHPSNPERWVEVELIGARRAP